MSSIELDLRSALQADRPVASVVITTRNQAHLLADAVRAAVGQELEGEHEVIVCDNASTDETERVMRRLVAGTDGALRYIRLAHDGGPAGGRNVGIDRARGAYVAFTDSDCVPSPRWLAAAIRAFENGVGIVQGRTIADRAQVPLFEHHIAIERFDGTFATANVVYRRDALAEERFDPRCWYWEDVDLGWRVVHRGWRVAFASDALVHHRVIPLRPLRWLLWPRRYATLPAIARRYPAFRRHLFLRVWVRPMHLLFELGLAGVALAVWSPAALVLVVPYAVAFARSRGLRGRFPPAKAAAHIARDLVSVIALAASSVRHRSLVL